MWQGTCYNEWFRWPVQDLQLGFQRWKHISLNYYIMYLCYCFVSNSTNVFLFRCKSLGCYNKQLYYVTTADLVMTWRWKLSLPFIKSIGYYSWSYGTDPVLCYSIMTLHTGQEVPLTASCVVTAEPRNLRTHHCSRS